MPQLTDSRLKSLDSGSPDSWEERAWGRTNHLEHHRDGLLACLGCPPFPVSIRFEKVFCTVSLEIGMGKGKLGYRDES